MLTTERLILRQLELDDAPFILELVNQPAWLRYIGDKGVYSLESARRYIEQGPMAMYQKPGFGLYLMCLQDATPIGMCGLLERDYLDHPDIGFALLWAYRSQGYGYEAARAIMDHAREALGLTTLVAITTTDNHASQKLLVRLGFGFDKEIMEPGSIVPLLVYRCDLTGDAAAP